MPCNIARLPCTEYSLDNRKQFFLVSPVHPLSPSAPRVFSALQIRISQKIRVHLIICCSLFHSAAHFLLCFARRARFFAPRSAALDGDFRINCVCAGREREIMPTIITRRMRAEQRREEPRSREDWPFRCVAVPPFRRLTAVAGLLCISISADAFLWRSHDFHRRARRGRVRICGFFLSAAASRGGSAALPPATSIDSVMKSWAAVDQRK